MTQFYECRVYCASALLPLIGASFLALSVDGMPLSDAQWLFIPTLLFTGVGLLAIRFRRSRLLFAVAATTLMLYFLPRNFADSSIGLLVLSLVFMTLGTLKESGFTSWRTALFLVQLGFLVTIMDWSSAFVGQLHDILALGSINGWSLTLPVQPLTLMTVFATCFFLCTRALRGGTPFYSGLLGALIATTGAVVTQGFSSECFVLATAFSLLLSAVEMSHDLAFRDALTGLPGRRALEEAFRRIGRPYVLAMVDVDHFKRFNDTYGHDAGDEALRMVGAELSRVEMGGRAFRYGGEEFTILFAGKTLEEVEDAIESVRERIAKRPFAIRHQDRPQKKPKRIKATTKKTPTTSVTVSIGVADATEKLDKPTSIIKRADQRLYTAKKAGRNRVVSA